MGDFTYKVNVKATVSDETSGNVFAMLMSANLDASTIQADVKDSTDNMVLLGSFSGSSSETPLEGNLTTYFANVEAVIDNNPITLTANVDISYYVYIYAIDQYDNDILIKRSDPVKLDIASTNVDVNATLFIGASTGSFHETRDDTNITQATVTSIPTHSDTYFGYIKRISDTPDYANVLYATLTADPGEFVVDAVYSFAVETPPATIASNETTKFLNLIESTNPARDYTTFTDPVNLLFKSSESFSPNSFSYEINTFYANVDSNVKYPMVFGTNYTLFHACRVRDMDLYVINQAGNVSTGEAPTIVSSTAAVSSTEQEFITNVGVAYTSGTGSFTVTTTLDRGSDIGDKDLYLYTAAFGYAEYDHAALLANLGTVFNVENVTTQTNPSLTLYEVFDANGDDMNVSDTNAIFVYQFASVGRDADEIASGAPTSNVTDFDGGSRILSEIPKIAYTAGTGIATVYHYAEDFDHLTFKVDQSIPQTPAELDAFARDLLVRYSETVIDPSPKSYAVAWTSTVTIDDESQTLQSKSNYFGGLPNKYNYLEITQGSTLTFTFTSPHDLYESDYEATTDTFTGNYSSPLGPSPIEITFDDPGLRGFNCISGHYGMNLVVKTIPSVVHRGRTSKGVVSDPIHTNHLGSAFNNLLDAESTVTIGASITTVNYLVTTSELTGNVDIQSFS